MPRLTPNFPAHASRDVWQDGWLSPRRSLFRCTQPGAAAHDRTPALPRSTRDGGAGGRGDGLGADQGGALPRRAALCDEGGPRAAGGWGLPLQHARPFARPAPAPTPSLGPVAVVGPRPMEPLRPGCPGPLYASAELRPPGSSEPQKGGQQPLGRPRGRRVTPVRRRVGAAGGGGRRGRQARRRARRERGGVEEGRESESLVAAARL